jgi:hypothetical protein
LCFVIGETWLSDMVGGDDVIKTFCTDLFGAKASKVIYVNVKLIPRRLF